MKLRRRQIHVDRRHGEQQNRFAKSSSPRLRKSIRKSHPQPSPNPIAQDAMSRPFPIGETPRPFCGIAVMAKASFPGRTKTRLVPPLTFKEAAAFNTAFLQDIAANIVSASRTASIRGYMAFGPPDAIGFFKEILPPGISLIEAWLADFGDCLFSAITHLLALGHSAGVVLNSDSPTLPTSLLVEAAKILARPGDRAVLGPSTDGGYYLLGLKAAHRHLFEGIDWSTERVAGQTMQRAREIGLPVHVLPPWYDVDELSALTQLCDELCDRRPFAAGLPSFRAQRTAALLQAMLRESDLAHRLGRVAAASIEGAVG
jgi:rSAM/selenodomain-associated transferase 1